MFPFRLNLSVDEGVKIYELQARIADMINRHRSEINRKDDDIALLTNDCRELAKEVNIRDMKLNELGHQVPRLG